MSQCVLAITDSSLTQASTYLAFAWQAGRREHRTVLIMGSPWEHEFDNDRRSAACVHDDCPHKIGSVGGFNPRRVRLEFGAELCRCGCHSSCPVTSERRMAVPVRAWREKCTCPGAEDERVREDRIKAGTPDYIREYRAAFDAVRVRAAGMSREQIRDLYEAELDARGLEIPMGEMLDADVDAIAGNYVTRVRLFGRSAVGFAKLVNLVTREHPR
jgi:hypothetical protein